MRARPVARGVGAGGGHRDRARLPSIRRARRGSPQTATRSFWFGQISAPLMSAALLRVRAFSLPWVAAPHMPRLVARQLGKPCIVGCSELEVDPSHQKARIAGNDIHEGDWLSIDGGTGEIYLGHGQISTEESKAELDEIARWKNATAPSRARLTKRPRLRDSYFHLASLFDDGKFETESRAIRCGRIKP